MIGALQRPGDHDEGFLPRHPAREIANCRGRKTGDGGGPVRRFRTSVRLAGDIGREPVEPGRVVGQELRIVQALDDQHMGERQHQRDIGIGVQPQPFGTEFVEHVVAERTDIDRSRPGPSHIEESVARDVAPDTAWIHLGVAQRRSAEHDDELGMAGDFAPRRVAADETIRRADDMRQDDVARSKTIILHRPHIAADRIEEPMQLALRVVETPGARPAVGAAVDRLVAVRGPHARQFGCDEIEGRLPIDSARRVRRRVPLRPLLRPGRGRRRARAVRGCGRARSRLSISIEPIGEGSASSSSGSSATATPPRTRAR